MFKTMSAFFEILKRLSRQNSAAFDYESAIFGVFAVKYKQSGLSKNADTVLDCE